MLCVYSTVPFSLTPKQSLITGRGERGSRRKRREGIWQFQWKMTFLGNHGLSIKCLFSDMSIRWFKSQITIAFHLGPLSWVKCLKCLPFMTSGMYLVLVKQGSAWHVCLSVLSLEVALAIIIRSKEHWPGWDSVFADSSGRGFVLQWSRTEIWNRWEAFSGI